MLVDLYLEALLADPDLADQVWELWNARLISGELAVRAWCILAMSSRQRGTGECFDDS